MASSDEGPPICTDLGEPSEAEKGRGDAWSQSDVTKRSGSVWKGGDTVVLNTIARTRDKREKEKGVSESGGLFNPSENIHRMDVRGREGQGEAGGGSLRRSSHPKPNWIPHPKEDPCERRRAMGDITMTARYRD